MEKIVVRWKKKVEDRALLKLEEDGQERQYSDWPRTGDAFKPLQVQPPTDLTQSSGRVIVILRF